MSVFIRPDSKDGAYSYDFRYRGHRFSGSTGKTARREAQTVERARREDAKQAWLAERALFGKELTLEQATARFWNEVGQYDANARNTMWSIDWLLTHFGDGRMLHDIGDSEIAAMVARRRGEFVPSQRRADRKYKKPHIARRVSNATVNRTVTQPLREIMLRASGKWSVRTQKIDWSKHLLPEPKERVREASPAEQSAIMGELERGYDDAVEFAFLNGCRRMEILGLRWAMVDFFGRRFTVLGKGGKLRTLPMSQRSFEILWAQQGRRDDAVFTYVAKRTVKMKDGRLLERGKRYPLTKAGLKSTFQRAVPNASVENFRFHDTRHTAATRVLRKSNLRVVQNLLGHADIATTTKYAHAIDDDIRAALEAASATETPTERVAPQTNVLKEGKKSA